MPPSPSGRAELSRSRLVDAAAAELIAGDGSFEITDFARRAGVSVGLAYFRFGSKAGLVSAVVDAFYDRVARVINLSDSVELDWGRRERERLTRLVAFLYSEPLAPILISKLARDPEVAAVESARWSELILGAARNISKAQKRGQIEAAHDPQILAALISGGIRHAVGHALASPRRPTQEVLTDEIWEFVARGLALPPATRIAPPAAPRGSRVRRRH
jgi:AcrR family transcriptional regulator